MENPQVWIVLTKQHQRRSVSLIATIFIVPRNCYYHRSYCNTLPKSTPEIISASLLLLVSGELGRMTIFYCIHFHVNSYFQQVTDPPFDLLPEPLTPAGQPPKSSATRKPRDASLEYALSLTSVRCLPLASPSGRRYLCPASWWPS